MISQSNDKPLMIFRNGICVIFIVWIIPFLLNKYPDQSFPYIDKDDIVSELVSNHNGSQLNLKSCPLLSPYIQHMSYDTYEKLEQPVVTSDRNFGENFHIKEGGVWFPKECNGRYKVIIILPYRGREAHLKTFLRYMHPFLQRQLLFYRIVVVEQDNDKSFNRAKLFNIGYRETKIWSSPRTCYIFHDIDLIPDNDLNIYACVKYPRHMTSVIDTFRYTLLYRDLLGGAVSMFSSQYEEINGFSNSFDGWGAEDDDLSNRMRRKNLSFVRFDPGVASYIMLPHAKEAPSPTRFETLNEKVIDMNHDGISSLTYNLHSINYLPLYTHILVSWD